MAWRPSKYLLEGELDNTVRGKVTGWMRFAGLKEKVTLQLRGDFHRDIRGATIRLVGGYRGSEAQAQRYMDGLAPHQTGKAGDITAGLPPQDYTNYPYIEWYSDANGRLVLELDREQVQVNGNPIPPEQAQPISRAEQWENLTEFAIGLARDASQAQPHGMKLLTQELRKQLPPLYGQEKLGGKATAYARFFTPDGSWTWWATEFDGKDTFFGLVEGHVRELGYFSLAELRQTRGPMGLAIERDLHFKPTPLDQIAPDLFKGPRLAP